MQGIRFNKLYARAAQKGMEWMTEDLSVTNIHGSIWLHNM